MADPKSKDTGKNIWSQISLDDLVAAIASLGDRIDQLKKETWRFNVKTRSPDSHWGEIIDKLKLNHNEQTRHSLYGFWNKKRHNIHKLVEKKKRVNNDCENDGNDGNIDETEEISVPSEKNSTSLPDPSLPLPQRPNTHANQTQNADYANSKDSFVCEVSLVLNAQEWKNAFSRTDQKMKPDWTRIFDKKLIPSIIQCFQALRPRAAGFRVRHRRYFACNAFLPV